MELRFASQRGEKATARFLEAGCEIFVDPGSD
jgi:hypothetical protein